MRHIQNIFIINSENHKNNLWVLHIIVVFITIKIIIVTIFTFVSVSMPIVT
jgi:hypothetical protein